MWSQQGNEFIFKAGNKATLLVAGEMDGFLDWKWDYSKFKLVNTLGFWESGIIWESVKYEAFCFWVYFNIFFVPSIRMQNNDAFVNG